jgi:hypothetical protein
LAFLKGEEELLLGDNKHVSVGLSVRDLLKTTQHFARNLLYSVHKCLVDSRQADLYLVNIVAGIISFTEGFEIISANVYTLHRN